MLYDFRENEFHRKLIWETRQLLMNSKDSHYYLYIMIVKLTNFNEF